MTSEIDLKLSRNIFLHFSFPILYRIIELLRYPRGISHPTIVRSDRVYIFAITRKNTLARSVDISGLLLIFHRPIFPTGILHVTILQLTHSLSS